MKSPRRTFLRSAVGAGLGLPLLGASCTSINNEPLPAHSLADYAELDAALKRPVLKKELFSDPVTIESCDLLEYNGNYMIRVRSKDGAEGYCVGHNIRMPHLYPIQLQLVNPFFLGRDARELDQLIDGVFMFKNNYKYQGIPYGYPSPRSKWPY